MEETNISQEQNPLGTAPVGGLIGKFAIPAIISMLVSALYNIVDQIFIGQGVGMLGNAATNVAFPVTTIATALALLLGIGGASNYNLEMGAGREKKASSIAGTALSTLVITGVILAVAVLLFFASASKLIWCNDRCYALCGGLSWDYSSGTPFLCIIHWRQSYCPRRQKPHIFYDLCSYRCHHQHNSGSPFHLLGLVGESRVLPGQR